MVRKNFSFNSFIFLIVLAFLLSACSNSNESNEAGGSSEPAEGGKVTFGLYAAPSGVFNPTLYSETNEAYVIDFVYESLAELDENLAWKPLLAKDWSFEDDNKTLVFHLQDNVTWHDGEPFTANDVKFTYEVIADQEYTGVRQDYAADLVGFEEYNSGQAEELSGVEVVDKHTVKFHFKEPNVLALFRASMDIIPEHIFNKYAVKDLPAASEVVDFEKLIGTGPFKASETVTNESYSLVRNEDYWQGKPYLDGVVWRVVNQDLASGLLENGEVDVLMGVSSQDYEIVSSLENVEMYEAPAVSYQWLGFKLNRRPQEDIAAKVINPEHYLPNEKFQDINLRQAIAYSINREGIAEGLLEGHGTVINGHIPPSSWAYNEDELNPYSYDPGKAKEILDDAGYEDVDGDGFRENPDGEKLVLKIDYASGNDVRDKGTPIIAQGLEEIGLKTDLHMPMDLGSLIGELENDTDMDIFIAGWSPYTQDPNPKVFWDSKSIWNVTRWNDDKQQSLLDAGIKTPEGFDQAYRQDIYNQWNAYVNEQLPMLPLVSINNIWAWNSKIKNVTPEQLKITRDVNKWYIGQ
ncbi:peptide ABC transporter substrate-binding protein [Bacillaceae bacterium Marseille-Q3522]|nr:peptide ABC transporter substrate-binding protein [Bacillaceae bacterium Marseille-Q3522]